MSHQPIILSDEEEELQNVCTTPFPTQPKKRRTELDPYPTTVLVLDDDPTPRKPTPASNTPSFVAETPFSELAKSDVSFVKCTRVESNPRIRVSTSDDQKFSVNGLICLESDNESESGSGRENLKENETVHFESDVVKDSNLSSRFLKFTGSAGTVNLAQTTENSSMHPIISEDDIHEVQDHSDNENDGLGQMRDVLKQNSRTKVNAEKKKRSDGAMGKKKKTNEERIRLKEENKLKKEQEKLQKAALKAEAAEKKKLEKEKKRWEKGKLALKCIVAEIDRKVAEMGSIGGQLLSRFAEKGLKFRITSNPIEGSIVWAMPIPEELLQSSSEVKEIRYVLIVYEAEEFCNLVINESLMDHVSSTQSCYPSYTICYLTNRLMAYINKREQGQYKNPTNSHGWKRPPVEEVLAKLTTHFLRVHSRQCVDEAELAEHVVGLTCSLASCLSRDKLTRLSVSANGSIIPKDSIDKNLIKKNLWLKALVAIPKVQPRFAIAIWKKYPTMKSLLSVYMDPSRSVHEKEFLLKDLTTEGLLGGDRRLGEICSKRVYRILMAQSGSIKTDDVEGGADFFLRN